MEGGRSFSVLVGLSLGCSLMVDFLMIAPERQVVFRRRKMGYSATARTSSTFTIRQDHMESRGPRTVQKKEIE